jgi:glycosyltransferase involved in cell wall biosynthesis
VASDEWQRVASGEREAEAKQDSAVSAEYRAVVPQEPAFREGIPEPRTPVLVCRLAMTFALVPTKLSVVIPVYNEKTFIQEILRRVQQAPYEKELVVVDDCSTDGTREWLQQVAGHQALGKSEISILNDTASLPVGNIRIFFQEKNRGKGAALRKGFAEVTGQVVIVQDADLEYDPKDYPKLLEPILDGRADVVFGSRFLGGPQRVHFFWHFVANSMLTLLSNMLTNLKLSDMETGYKAFRTEVVRGMRLRSNRFGFEPEVTARVAKGKWRVYEVPISYYGRTYAEGKKITWRDGALALWYVIRFNLFG